MSKLFKELNYDTDLVMQPGDPITSPDGHTTVLADNSGKAKIILPSGSLKHPKIVFAAGSYVTGTKGTYTWNNETTYDFSSWTPDSPISDYTNVNGLQLWWNYTSGYTFSVEMSGSLPYVFEVSDSDTYNPTYSGMHSNGGSYNPSFVGTVTITRDPILAEKTLATEDLIPTLDRMTSPDGESVVVQANNDGTLKKTTKEAVPKECLYATFDAAGHTVAMSFNNTKDELLAGLSEIEFTFTYDGVDYACSAVNPGGGGSYVDYVQIRSDLSWLDGAGTEIDGSGVVVIFSLGDGAPVSGAMYGSWVNSTVTKQIVQEVSREIATTDQLPDMTPVATKSAVNTAIGTINDNFTDIETMLTLEEESNVSVGSVASGWSFSADGSTWNNKLRFFHCGHIAYIAGSAKCSSALTAGAMTSSIGTMSLPSGYTLIGANAGIPGGDYWFWSSAAGVMGCKTFVSKTANTSLAIRLIFVLLQIGNKYTKTTVEDI